MEFNLLLVCVGLIICFGGIYFRKICAGIMGLIWGALTGIIVVILRAFLVGDIWALMYESDDNFSMTVIMIIAVAVCALSVWLDRLCAAINTFLSSLFAVLMIGCLFAEDMDALAGIIIIAVLAAGVLAVAAFIYYNYAFILVTAFSGAYIASLGGLGLIEQSDLNEVLLDLFLHYGDDGAGKIIIVSTIILGCLGCFVQLKRLKKMNIRSGKTAVSKPIKPLYERVINSEAVVDLYSEKLCLVIGLIGFVIFPLANDHMNWMETGLALFVNQAYFILETAAFAGVIYLAYNKKIRSSIVYCIPYLVVRLIIDGSWIRYSMVIALLKMAEPFIVLLVSFLLDKIIKTDFKYWLSVLTLIFYRYLLFRWVNLRELYWAITKDDVIPILALIILLAILVYVRNKKNIFDITLFINQKAGKQVANNRVVAITAGILVVVLAGVVVLANYVQEERYDNSAAGQYENRNDENRNDENRNGTADLREIDTDYLSGSSWEVLCMFDSNDKEVSQYDILGSSFGSPFGISFYGEEWGYSGNMYGLYLGKGTKGEMDNERWGEYSCKNNVISLVCDMHGDILDLEYTSVTYEGEVYEALRLTETITDEYEYSEVYTMYLVDQSDVPVNNDNQGSESTILETGYRDSINDKFIENFNQQEFLDFVIGLDCHTSTIFVDSQSLDMYQIHALAVYLMECEGEWDRYYDADKQLYILPLEHFKTLVGRYLKTFKWDESWYKENFTSLGISYYNQKENVLEQCYTTEYGGVYAEGKILEIKKVNDNVEVIVEFSLDDIVYKRTYVLDVYEDGSGYYFEQITNSSL